MPTLSSVNVIILSSTLGNELDKTRFLGHLKEYTWNIYIFIKVQGHTIKF